MSFSDYEFSINTELPNKRNLDTSVLEDLIFRMEIAAYELVKSNEGEVAKTLFLAISDLESIKLKISLIK